MKRLEGKVALITGGGAGIGAAAARVFCQEGAAVMLVDAQADALEKTAKVLSQSFPVKSFLADVADEQKAREAARHAVDAFGRLDVLVNNAAMRNYSALSEASTEEWRAVTAVNLIGMANYCKAALPALRASGRGSIVNVSSCYAVTGRAGSTLTDFHVARAEAAGKTVEALKAERQDNSLIGRWAEPREVAWPILWLASDEASFITGSTLMVDGGLSIL